MLRLAKANFRLDPTNILRLKNKSMDNLLRKYYPRKANTHFEGVGGSKHTQRTLHDSKLTIKGIHNPKNGCHLIALLQALRVCSPKFTSAFITNHFNTLSAGTGLVNLWEIARELGVCIRTKSPLKNTWEKLKTHLAQAPIILKESQRIVHDVRDAFADTDSEDEEEPEYHPELSQENGPHNENFIIDPNTGIFWPPEGNLHPELLQSADWKISSCVLWKEEHFFTLLK